MAHNFDFRTWLMCMPEIFFTDAMSKDAQDFSQKVEAYALTGRWIASKQAGRRSARASHESEMRGTRK